MTDSMPALSALILVFSLWGHAHAASAPLPAQQPPRRVVSPPLPGAIFYPEPGYEDTYIALQQRLVAAYGGPHGVRNAIKAGYVVPPHLGAVITGAGLVLASWDQLLAFQSSVGRVVLNAPLAFLYAPTGQPRRPPNGEEGTFADKIGRAHV